MDSPRGLSSATHGCKCCLMYTPFPVPRSALQVCFSHYSLFVQEQAGIDDCMLNTAVTMSHGPQLTRKSNVETEREKRRLLNGGHLPLKERYTYSEVTFKGYRWFSNAPCLALHGALIVSLEGHVILVELASGFF
jgi:hypothetical protein